MAEAHLADDTGQVSEVTVSVLLARPDFVRVGSSVNRVPLPARGTLEGLPEEVADPARWWERHMVEVLRGTPPDAPAGTEPRREYDPARSSLRQREAAKIAELAASGTDVGFSTFQRMQRAYERRGLLGLVDGRLQRRPSSRIDPRVIEAI